MAFKPAQYAAQEQRHIDPVIPELLANLVLDLLIKVAADSIAMATIDLSSMPRELFVTLAGVGLSIPESIPSKKIKI